MRTCHVLEIRVEHSGVRCSVAADGPSVQHDLVGIEAELVNGVLHDDVDGVALLLGEGLTLRNRDMIYRNTL